MTVDRVFNGMYLFGAFAILLGGFQLEFFATTGSGEIGWAFAKSFIGSTTWAGASAAIMANVVLIGYIIVAMMEDQGDREEEARTKKGL